MHRRYIIRSGAKINIGLRVLSKRSDGYHNIETIFYPVKLWDMLTVTLERLNRGNTGKNIVTIKTKPELNIENEKNICSKAVDLFFEEFQIEGSYKINIKIVKNIPIGAGLGGGSSNGATILKIFCRHFLGEARFIEQNILRMRKTALMLGSDVPFFLLNKPSYASSRGELLTPLGLFRIEQEILIVNPGIHVSTAWAYSQLRVPHAGKVNSRHMNLIRKFDPEVEIYVNDFEQPVFTKYPDIGKIKADMYRLGASFSLMSGSGSTVFGLFKKKADIESARKYFTNKNYLTFTA